MTYVDNVNPMLKLAFGPVTIWRILMGSWRDVIEYTADRVALLLPLSKHPCYSRQYMSLPRHCASDTPLYSAAGYEPRTCSSGHC